MRLSEFNNYDLFVGPAKRTTKRTIHHYLWDEIVEGW